MDLQLNGNVALATGVSYGIGAAVADAFVRDGMSVFATSRLSPKHGYDIVHMPLDMSEQRRVARRLTHAWRVSAAST